MKPKPTLKTYRARYTIPDVYSVKFPATLTQHRKTPLGKRGVQDWASKMHDVERGKVEVLSIEEVKP